MDLLNPTSERRPEPAWPWEQALNRIILALGHSARGRDGQLHGRGILRVFEFAERLAQHGHRKQLLRPGGILHYEIGPFPGQTLPLPSGPPVHKGEPIVILHWANQNVAALRESFQDRRTMTFQGSRVVRDELRLLVDLADGGGLPAGLRVVWTKTVMYPMLRRFGFSTRAAPQSLSTPFVRLYLLGLLSLYGTGVPDRIRGRPQHLKLGEAWISLDVLRRHCAAPS